MTGMQKCRVYLCSNEEKIETEVHSEQIETKKRPTLSPHSALGETKLCQVTHGQGKEEFTFSLQDKYGPDKDSSNSLKTFQSV